MTGLPAQRKRKLPFGVELSAKHSMARRGEATTEPMAREVFMMMRQAFQRHPRMVRVDHVRDEWRAAQFAPQRSPFEVARDVKAALNQIGLDLVQATRGGWLLTMLNSCPPANAPDIAAQGTEATL